MNYYRIKKSLFSEMRKNRRRDTARVERCAVLVYSLKTHQRFMLSVHGIKTPL